MKMRKRKAHYLLFLPLTHGEAGPGLERQWELKSKDFTPRTLVAFKSQNFYRESRL